MVDDVSKGSKTPVMVEAAFHVGPQPFERGCAIAPVRRPICLEGIDANLFRSMQVPTRLRKERRNVTGCTLSLPVEKFLTSRGWPVIKTPGRRLRSHQRDLIRVQRMQFLFDQI